MTDKPNSELLPCPCGGIPKRRSEKGGKGSSIGTRSRWYRGWIECQKCGMTSRVCKRPDAVAVAWNNTMKSTRTPQSLDEQEILEVMRKAIGRTKHHSWGDGELAGAVYRVIKPYLATQPSVDKAELVAEAKGITTEVYTALLVIQDAVNNVDELIPKLLAAISDQQTEEEKN